MKTSRSLPLGLCFLLAAASNISAQQSPTTAALPFRLDYGPALEVKHDAGAPGGQVFSSQAASTGDGGWLVCWGQTDFANWRLMTRLLPPAFETPPAAGWSGSWTGNAGPPLGLAGRPLLMKVLPGTGGALLVWQEPEQGMQAQWFSQAASGPAGARLALSPLPLPGPALEGAADGETYWVWAGGTGAEGLPGGYVVTRTAGGELTSRGFTTGAVTLLYPRLTAGQRRLHISSHFWKPEGATGVRSLTVDAASTVSGVRELDLPEDGFWLGAMPHGAGFYGVWAVNMLSLDAVIFGRSMTADGAWAAGSAVDFLGPARTNGGALQLTAGTGVSLLTSSYEAYRVRPGQPLERAVGVITPPGNSYALSATRLLVVANSGGDRLTVSRYGLAQEPYVQTITSYVTEGTGWQSAPQVSWTPGGPRLVFQVSSYGAHYEAGIGGEITGVSRQMGAQNGPRFFNGPFSSPAQAWLGSFQMVAWRRPNADPNGPDPDDVYGTVLRNQEDGRLVETAAPFLIAGGPGSQRAVAVAGQPRNGVFIAVWRESESAGAGTVLSEIRTATIDAFGTVTPPGGRLVDISTGELSAPATDGTGTLVYKVEAPPGSRMDRIRRARVYSAAARIEYADLSPPEHDAAAPQVLWVGGSNLITWRDTRTDRIYLHRQHLVSPLAVVSPPEHEARQPGLAALSATQFAVFWINDAPYPREVWVAVAYTSGPVSAPVLVAVGNFDKDTLSVSGDGQGRVALALQEGGVLRTLLVAPLTAQQGGLALVRAAGGEEVSWTAGSALFPHAGETVEASYDLRKWTPLSGLMPVLAGPGSGRCVLTVPSQAGVRTRYFRLRAALTGP